jgi:hypothetical protein
MRSVRAADLGVVGEVTRSDSVAFQGVFTVNPVPWAEVEQPLSERDRRLKTDN